MTTLVYTQLVSLMLLFNCATLANISTNIFDFIYYMCVCVCVCVCVCMCVQASLDMYLFYIY